MLVQHYAHALFESLQGKDTLSQDELLVHFYTLLDEQDHKYLLPQITREYEKIALKQEAKEQVVVTVSQSEDASKYSKEIDKDLAKLGFQTLQRRLEVDTTLVGGYTLEAHGQRIDASYKKHLLDLYNTLLSAQ